MDFIAYILIILPIIIQLPFSIYFVRRKKFIRAMLVNLLFPIIYGLVLLVIALTVKGSEFALVMWPIYSIVGLVGNYIYILIANLILKK